MFQIIPQAYCHKRIVIARSIALKKNLIYRKDGFSNTPWPIKYKGISKRPDTPIAI